MLLCRRSPATGPSTCCFFFFNDTATTEIYTLSLHDALPIAQGERAFFIGDMTRLVPQQELPYEPRETATPVLDEAGSRLYVGTNNGWVRCRFHGRTVWSWRAGGSILAAPLLDRETLYVAAA